jgi:NAD(P)-dependent dehydrogenase (short-subunit alcohol dehydrogenase family)
LITGCSSGIGKACAAYLAERGYTVWATARNVSALAELAASGCHLGALDVNDEDSMQATLRRIESAHGPVGALINNAGYSQPGVIESVPLARVRAQFETNVFGLVRLTQLVLPGMRAQRRGRIVNVSSMGGRLTFPGYGFYHATKYAVEALSDALRFEVRGFGIHVVLIEPGLIRSKFGESALTALGHASGSAENGYGEFQRAVEQATADWYEKGLMARLAGEPLDVARTIERALRAARPRARYVVTGSAKLLLAQRALLSDGAWDWMLRTTFPSPGQR